MFPDSSLVFVPDAEARFIPARCNGAIQPGKPGHVWLLDDAGKPKFQLELPASMTSSLVRMDEESLRSIPDMVNLKLLTEASVLHNLRLRFRADEVYTGIGDVLIAVNPFKMLPVYTPIVLDSYISSSSPSSMDPHIYKVADTAFRRLVQLKRNQACLVTGESGSGKTETTKVFLQYLAEVSSAWSGQDGPAASQDRATSLSDQILKSNPLLESFGNASTRKNTNSSRFGKLIEIMVDTNRAEISGARTTIFLLEKSRLPSPAEGERNFHVFYQLCAGARAHPEIREKYEVLDEDEFRYLHQEEGSPIKSMDIIGWEELVKAANVLKISSVHQDEAFRLVSGILHLGNLEFEPDAARSHSEASRVANPATLATAERLLGLSGLERALTLKSVSAGGDTLFQHQSVEKAKKLRDALAIVLYSALFNFMAARVNDQLVSADGEPVANKNATALRTMGILDIFGFESFPGANNSFEQLCINYCNEKLQHQFNEYVFSKERLEYERESVVFSSNPSALLEKSQKGTMLVLELFEKPRVGIFHLMDEESAVPGGSDSGLLKRMVQEYPSWNSSFVLAKKELLDTAFVVRHYAGPVIYKIAGLLEKNEEGSLSKDSHALCSRSSLEIIRSAVAGTTSSSSTTGAMAGKAHLGSQFVAQLDRLVRSLNEMEPHFVRCIKPNEARKGGVFHAGMVLEQLRYAGILEVCKIRQLGFPIRRDFVEFKNRYAPLAKSSRRFLSSSDIKLAVETMCGEFLSDKVIGDPANFACGKTKIFLKSHALVVLEEQLERIRSTKVLIIQRRARGYLVRRAMKQVRMVLTDMLPAAIANSDLANLRAALGNEQLKRLLHGGKHIMVVQQGWKKATSLQEAAFGHNLISRAVMLRDSHAIRSALTCSARIVPQDDSIVIKAQSLLEELVYVDSLIKDMQVQVAAIATTPDQQRLQLETLSSIVSRAEILAGNAANSSSLLEIVLEQGKAKMRRIQEEMERRSELTVAMESRSKEKVAEIKARLLAIGVSNEDESVRRASLFLKEDINLATALSETKTEDQGNSVLQALTLAVESADPDTIASALIPVIAQGLINHSIAQHALQTEKTLRRTKESEQSLNDIAALLEIKTKHPGASGLSLEDLSIVSEVCEKVAEQQNPRISEEKSTKDDEHENEGKTDETNDLKARATELATTAQEIVEAQNALHAVLAIGPSIDFTRLRATLERAYACGLTKGEVVYRVQKMMRAKNRERRLAKKKVVFDMSGKVPEKRKKTDIIRPEAQSGAELLSMARAEGSRYLLNNFYQVRPVEEGESPHIQHKQGRVLEQCLLESTPALLPADGSVTAETISKLILGYTGERSASFPPTCARSLLELGASASELGDEMYVQVCAHLTENNNVESATRSWQLICLMVATFLPSTELLPHIVRFLLDRAEGRTDAAMTAERIASGSLRSPLPATLDNYTLEQRYAWYCVKRLLREIASAAASSATATPKTGVLSMEEIQAFGERVPFVTNITYPDGSVLLEDALIGPTMTVLDATKLCLKAALITQGELEPTFGLFVRPVDKAAMAALAASASTALARNESSLALVHEDSSLQDEELDDKGSQIISKPSRRLSARLNRVASKGRFRLSITAVFGFARGNGSSESWNPKSMANASTEEVNKDSATAEDEDQAVALFGNASRSRGATARGNGASAVAGGATQNQKKKSMQIGAKRTEDELDWDVPLVPGDYIGDILLRYLRAGRGAPRLVFKKRIFIPELEAKTEETRRKDVKSAELALTQVAVSKIEVAQANDDFATGALPFDRDDDVAEVVAARVALKFDNRLPETDPERLMAIAQVESFIPAPWRHKKSELNWARAVLEKQAKVNNKETAFLNQRVLERCKARALYGAQLFRVSRKGEPVESLLAVSKQGFTLLSAKDYKVTGSYEFKDVEEFKIGKSGTFLIKPNGSDDTVKALTLVTANPREIFSLAQEYARVYADWDPKEGTAEACRRLLADRSSMRSSVRTKPVVQQTDEQTASSKGDSSGVNHPLSPRGLPIGRGIAPSIIDDGIQGQFEEVPLESLRDRMEKLGATKDEIAELIRG